MSCGAPERMTRAAPSPLRGRLRCAPAFAAPGAASNRHFETSGVRIPRPVHVAEPSALRLRSCPVAPRRGFEPLTHGLEGRCSIRLSYRGRIFRPAFGLQPAACSADRGFESSRPRPRGPLTRSGPPVRTGRGRGMIRAAPSPLRGRGSAAFGLLRRPSNPPFRSVGGSNPPDPGRAVHSPAADRLFALVGVEGFEPPTSCSQSRRATRLRYTPRCPPRRSAAQQGRR